MLKPRRNHLPKKLVIAVLIGITVILSVLIILKKIEPVSAEWWDDSWAYRRAIPVTNNTTTESNVYIIITGIDASDTTKFQADCGDIRFTDINGKSLPYYLATACGANTTIHVNFTTFPAGAQIIYMYYGNPSVADGFVSSDFANLATNYTVGALVLEEKSTVPVGYWKFDEGAENTCSGGVNDVCNSGSAGNTIDGTSTATRSETGKFGRALDFDGSQYITLPTTTILNPSEITISAWVNPDSTPYGGATYNYCSLGARNLGMIASRNGADFDYVFGLNSSRQVEFCIGTSGTRQILSSATLTAGTFSHVAVTFNSSKSVSIYINGKLDSSATFTNNMPVESTSAYLGAYYSGAGYLSGILDEVKIYNYALTATQVKVDYNRGSGVVMGALSDNSSYEKQASNQEYCIPGDTTSCVAPVGEWKFEEGSGNNVNDTSGNNNSGTWSGTGSRYTVGKIGKAGNLALSTSDYVDLTSKISSFNTLSAGTLEAWINMTSSGYVFGECTVSGTAPGMTLFVGDYAGAFAGESITFHYYNTAGTTLLMAGYLNGNNYLLDNKWHHIAFTVANNGSGNSMYVDGLKVPLSYYTGGSASTEGYFMNSVDFSALYLGNTKYSGAMQDSLTGKLDNVRIFNYARTPAQIAWDYNRGAPIGYWKFDEGAEDTCSGGVNDVCNSGNGGDTTLDGISTATRSRAGKFGGDLDFDGSTNVVTITNTAAIDLNNGLASAFTVSAWINADSDGEGHTGQIFWKGDKTYLRVSGLSGSNLNIDASLDLATTATKSLSAPITTGTWNHLVMVYDSSTAQITLYVNGVNKGSSTNGVGAPNAESNNLLIGGTTTANFDGKIDEVKVYNYALTATQVKVDYNRGSGLVMGALSDNSSYEKLAANQEYCIPGDSTSCAAPLSEWKLEEGTGSTAFDTGSSGSNNATWQGTLGGQWVSGKIGKAGNFNGSDNRISLGTTLSAHPDSRWTISGWIKTSNTASWDSGGHAHIKNGMFGHDNGYIKVGVNNGHAAVSIYTGSLWQRTEGSTLVANGNWHHLAFVNSANNNILIYIDGIYETVSTLRSSVPASTLFNELGSSTSGGTGSSGLLTGQLDNLLYFNYALSAAQVAWDYNRGAPLGYWKFDECQGTSLYDASGNSNTGTWSGSGGTQTSVGTCITASTAWGNGVTGKFNSSLNFDGADDYVSITHTSSLDVTTAWTASVWTYVTSAPSTQRDIFTDGYSDANIQFNIGYNTNSKIGCWIDDSGIPYTAVSDINSVLTNQWQMSTCVYDGPNGTLKLYLDGNLVKTTTGLPSAITSTTSNKLIGANNDLAAYLNAKIDDVRLYNYALTATQVKLLYNQGGSVRFGPATGIP